MDRTQAQGLMGPNGTQQESWARLMTDIGRFGSPAHDSKCHLCWNRLDLFISDWLDGVDVAARHPTILAHLRGCQSCQVDALLMIDLLAIP